jgi:hypothetical protein
MPQSSKPRSDVMRTAEECAQPHKERNVMLVGCFGLAYWIKPQAANPQITHFASTSILN